MTAIFLPCVAVRMWLSRVVLPLPRKPVSTVTGTVEINRNAFGIRILRGAIGDKVRLVVGLEGDEIKAE